MATIEDAGAQSATISRAAVQLLREYTGRGPTRARTTINDDSVLIVLGDTLTKGERTLAERGKRGRVMQVRHDYQQLMREGLVEAVEQTLDRTVIAFMSDNHVDPDLAVEVFILKPVDPPGHRLARDSRALEVGRCKGGGPAARLLRSGTSVPPRLGNCMAIAGMH